MEQEAKPVLLGFREIYARYGAGRSEKAFRMALWRWTREGRFPAPLEVSPWSRAWRTADVEAWEASLVRVSYAPAPEAPSRG